MDLMSLLMIAGSVVVILIVLMIAVPACLYLDVMSYTAKGSKTLSPAGTSIGQALVVYDPGVSGAAKKASVTIAGDLQSKGYTVNLAGVRSPAATNVSGYEVIIVTGPTYWDKLGTSAQSYLQGLNVSQNVKIGVLATGIGVPKSNDPAYMMKFVANLPENIPVKVRSAMKLVTDMSGNEVDKTSEGIDRQYSEFVSTLLV